MALIVRPEVVDACIGYGRAVEKEIKENIDTELTDDKLEELCEPLLKRIKTDTEKQIRSELEEQQAQEQDDLAEEEYENNISSRKSNVADTVIINIKQGKEIQKKSYRRYLVGDLLSFRNNKHSRDEEHLDHSIKKCKKRKPTVDVDDKSDVLEHSTDDEYWDDCKEQIDIELEKPYDEFIGLSSTKVLRLLDKHTSTPDDMLTMLQNLSNLGITSISGFDLLMYIELIEMANKKYAI